MLPLSTLNSVKERGRVKQIYTALRSQLFAKGQTRRGGSRIAFLTRRSFSGGGSEGDRFLILNFSFPL